MAEVKPVKMRNSGHGLYCPVRGADRRLRLDFHPGDGCPSPCRPLASFCGGRSGGKRGTLAVLVYLLLGAVGIPVFAGFSGGVGCLLGSTGGYLVGICSRLS